MTQLTLDILTIFAEAQAPETLRALHVEEAWRARQRASATERSNEHYARMKAESGDRYRRKLERSRHRAAAVRGPRRQVPRWKRQFLTARSG